MNILTTIWSKPGCSERKIHCTCNLYCSLMAIKLEQIQETDLRSLQAEENKYDMEYDIRQRISLTPRVLSCVYYSSRE